MDRWVRGWVRPLAHLSVKTRCVVNGNSNAIIDATSRPCLHRNLHYFFVQEQTTGLPCVLSFFFPCGFVSPHSLQHLRRWGDEDTPTDRGASAEGGDSRKTTAMTHKKQNACLKKMFRHKHAPRPTGPCVIPADHHKNRTRKRTRSSPPPPPSYPPTHLQVPSMPHNFPRRARLSPPDYLFLSGGLDNFAQIQNKG